MTLVLIGASALHGCGGPDQPTQVARDVYKDKASCVRDWGDERKCEQAPTGSTRTSSGYYYGPSYSHTGTSEAPRRGSNAVSTHTVSRSGFGSSASAHGASS